MVLLERAGTAEPWIFDRPWPRRISAAPWRSSCCMEGGGATKGRGWRGYGAARVRRPGVLRACRDRPPGSIPACVGRRSAVAP
ncbi:hypothetical protein ACFQX6_41160 [Streptosporangium lutulentum]